MGQTFDIFSLLPLKEVCNMAMSFPGNEKGEKLNYGSKIIIM